jgi:cytochrome c551/c552|tara:strand:- start:556 stop:879 length:324 start_codon:yes stop_codon:yes gene_type:complete
MKKIIILLTAMLLSTAFVNADDKKTLANTLPKSDCLAEHKISPKTLGCGIKKLFKKKDGSPNAMGKFFNAKSFADLKNKEISETPDYKPKVGIMDKLKEKIGKLRKK